MRFVEEYRQQAVELRKLAEKERNAPLRERMIALARTYETLADQRESFLELQELLLFRESHHKG